MNLVGMNNETLKQEQDKMFAKTHLGRGWRIVIWFAVGIVFLLSIGALYQAVGTAVDRRTYPAPGQLVDVGGFQMHIYCTGEGRPTVILDHVGAANSAEWALIQPIVAAQTRVCAYDRAGFGWSEAGPGPRDAEHNAQELHTLLANAGITGPFVFAGHSFGGNVGRVYAADFPAEIAGLVLVDPGLSLHRPGVPQDIDAQWQTQDAGFMQAAPWLARVGLLRLMAALSLMPGHGDLPLPQGNAFDAFQKTNQFYNTLKAQNLAVEDTSAQVLAAETHLGDLPLIVLSAGLPENDRGRQVLTEVNAGIADHSANGDHRIVAGSEHMALAVSQEYATQTAAAILEMVAVVRGERPLTPSQP